MSDYGPWILFIRMWSCLGCRRIWSGGDEQCGYCMKPKTPDDFLF